MTTRSQQDRSGDIGESIRKWLPLLMILVTAAVNYGLVRAAMDELPELKKDVAQSKLDNAVQKEQIAALVNFLQDVRSDIKELAKK